MKNHYEGRRLLKPKEQDVIKHSLNIFFNEKSEKPEVTGSKQIRKETMSPARTEMRTPTKVEATSIEMSPRPVINDDTSQENV